MSDPLTAATGLVGGLEGFFTEARRLNPWPAGRQCREVAACGSRFTCLYLPWRRNRRGVHPLPPPVALDAGERIIMREALWRDAGLALTPNRYPFAPDHLLLWEEAPVREPGPVLLQVLARICAARPDLLGLVNTIGAAATVARAHAQLAVVPEAQALSGVAIQWEQGQGFAFGFPADTTSWPAFFVALRGEPERVALALQRLLRLRRTAAFNLVARGDRVYFFPRTRECSAPSFPLPLGALELAGVFGFEDQPSYRAMTGELVARALVGTCWPPSAAAGAALRKVLLD